VNSGSGQRRERYGRNRLEGSVLGSETAVNKYSTTGIRRISQNQDQTPRWSQGLRLTLPGGTAAGAFSHEKCTDQADLALWGKEYHGGIVLLHV
jgi:hypothetical protein